MPPTPDESTASVIVPEGIENGSDRPLSQAQSTTRKEPRMDVQSEMIEVPAAGGTMPALLARPAAGSRAPGVLVIQEAFGLNGHIKDVARRIAAEGYVALAPDLYWRGGKGRAVGYDQLPEAIALMQSLNDKDVISDVGSAVAYLETQPSVRADRIGITGFCMGGRVRL